MRTRKAKLFCYSFAMSFLLLSCKNETKEQSNSINHYNSSSKVKVDTFTSGRLATICQSLGVPELDNVYDSIQIRIWMPCDYGVKQNLFLLHYRAGRWFSKFYYFNVQADSTMDIKVISSTLEIKEPKSGWNAFIDSLENTGIQSLPDYRQIKGYTGGTDPLSIYVEISKKNYYRYYTYPDFEQNRQLKEGPARLETALNLIKSEFNYEWKCN